MKLQVKAIFIATAISFLTACGGGGGGGSSGPTNTGPVASSLAFPLLSAFKSTTAKGSSYVLHATGTTATQSTDGLCTGTLSETDGPATTPATFEGSASLSSVSVGTISFTNCTPASTSATEADYYDSNYIPLGVNIQGGNYGVYLVAPQVPTTVTVGSTGLIGTLTYYADSTKATSAGRSDKSYVVEADTASSAIINVISKVYDASGNLTHTTQSRSRIDAAGNITPVSEDIQYSFTSTLHLVFR